MSGRAEGSNVSRRVIPNSPVQPCQDRPRGPPDTQNPSTHTSSRHQNALLCRCERGRILPMAEPARGGAGALNLGLPARAPSEQKVPLRGDADSGGVHSPVRCIAAATSGTGPPVLEPNWRSSLARRPGSGRGWSACRRVRCGGWGEGVADRVAIDRVFGEEVLGVVHGDRPERVHGWLECGREGEGVLQAAVQPVAVRVFPGVEVQCLGAVFWPSERSAMAPRSGKTRPHKPWFRL